MADNRKPFSQRPWHKGDVAEAHSTKTTVTENIPMMTIKKITLKTAVLSAATVFGLISGGTNSMAASKGQLYVFEADANGFHTKTLFYDNGVEVVAFDSQFTEPMAEQAIAFLRTKTSNPITYLVITHPNPDKFNGLMTFKNSGAKVIASQQTKAAMPGVHAYKKSFFVSAKMFTEASYPKLGSIDIDFSKEFELTLGNGEKIQLSELSGPGVSSNQTIAHIPQVNALVVGDLVHHNAHAWLEGGIVGGKPVPTIASWIRDLEELSSKYSHGDPIVYGGRGEAAPLSVAVSSQINYLKKADQIVSVYVAKLGNHRNELLGSTAQTHFANLQKIFEAAFPDYALGYMIQYGVYGLALSK